MTATQERTIKLGRSKDVAIEISFHEFGSIRHGCGEPPKKLQPESIVGFETDGSYSISAYLDSGHIVSITWLGIEELVSTLTSLTAQPYVSFTREKLERQLFIAQEAIKGYFSNDSGVVILLRGDHTIRIPGMGNAEFEEQLNADKGVR